MAGSAGMSLRDLQQYVERFFARLWGEGAVSEMANAQGPGDVKPGWTTTEFWQTVFVHVIAAVVALGTVVHTNFNLNGLQAIVPTIALVASALAQSVYSHSRATVKSSAQKAEAEVKLAGTAGGSQPSGGRLPRSSSG
jgi:hypothetical protein